jgi:hypothetical protein
MCSVLQESPLADSTTPIGEYDNAESETIAAGLA